MNKNNNITTIVNILSCIKRDKLTYTKNNNIKLNSNFRKQLYNYFIKFFTENNLSQLFFYYIHYFDYFLLKSNITKTIELKIYSIICLAITLELFKFSINKILLFQYFNDIFNLNIDKESFNSENVKNKIILYEIYFLQIIRTKILSKFTLNNLIIIKNYFNIEKDAEIKFNNFILSFIKSNNFIFLNKLYLIIAAIYISCDNKQLLKDKFNLLKINKILETEKFTFYYNYAIKLYTTNN